MSPGLRAARAQALIEFTFAVPVIIVLLLALVDGSALFRSAMTCKAAADEAARIVARDAQSALGDERATIRAALSSADAGDGYEMTFTQGAVDSMSWRKEVPDSGKPGVEVSKNSQAIAIECGTEVSTQLGRILGLADVPVSATASALRVW